MQKVKLKQIDFGGTSDQYVKGDGTLGVLKGLYTIDILETYDSDIDDYTYSCNRTGKDIYDNIIVGEKTPFFTIYNPDTKKRSSLAAYITNTTNRNGVASYYCQLLDIQEDIQHGAYVMYQLSARYNANTGEVNTTSVSVEPFSGFSFKYIDGEPTGKFNYNDYDTLPIYTHDGEYYPNAIQDVDGNWYGAIIIGNQVWLGENLKTTKYADGTPIVNGGTGNSSSEPQYYEIEYTTNNVIDQTKRGLRYNWAAVMNGATSTNNKPSGVQGLAPEGCHIPSAAEWTELLTYVTQKSGKFGNNPTKALSSQLATFSGASWKHDIPAYQPEKNNATGFSALATGEGGAPNYSNGQPLGYSTECYFASCTDGSITGYLSAFGYVANADNNEYFSLKNYSKVKGISVRCVIDKSPILFRAWYIEKYGSMQHHISEGGSSQTIGEGNLNIKIDDAPAKTFNANQTTDLEINFKSGVGVVLSDDESEDTIKISTESHHTVISKNAIITAENNTKIYAYDVRCDLNGTILKVGNLSDFVGSDKSYSYNNTYVWEKDESETGKYMGICRISSTEGCFVFKLDITNAADNKTTTHYFGLLADTPSDATFTFVSTCDWEIVVRLDSNAHMLLAYMRIPDTFYGSVSLTPLRKKANNNNPNISCFDYSSGTTIRNYSWGTQISGGSQEVDTVTELIGNVPVTNNSTNSNYVRTPTGNYQVNVIGDFGNNLVVGSKISDAVVNDYYLHTLEKRLESFTTAASLYTALGIPQPTIADAGKMLMVNENGQYELVLPSSNI